MPNLPPCISQELAQMVEPERASRWLRYFFEEVQYTSVIQIAIWQAYEAAFHHAAPMRVPEFIKTITRTYSTARGTGDQRIEAEIHN